MYWLSQTSSVWDKHFIQTTDIDLSTTDPAISTWDNGAGWSPIGIYPEYEDSLSVEFAGSYDGNNKTINGLFINRPNTNFVGFFGSAGLDSSNEIKNLGLTNIEVTGRNYVGSLVGQHKDGNINNCYSSGSVTGYDETGGLVGCSNGSIINCYNIGNVTGDFTTGGLIGHSDGIIANCYNNGNVIGRQTSGGLIGVTYSNITNCYNTGTVTGDGRIGGLIGEYISGYAINCYNTGYITGNYEAGGLVGYNNSESILNSFWDIETSGQTTSAGGIGKTTTEMKTQTTYTDAGWLFPIWAINPSTNDGYPYLYYSTSVPTDDPNNSFSSTIARLHTAYPNPFNPSTTLSFDVPNSEKVVINIFNVKGQLVKNLCNQVYDKGYHSIVWDGKDKNGTRCGTGVYFYKMQAGNITQTQKMMMIK